MVHRWTREDIVNDFYIQGIPIIPILVPDGVTVVGFTNILLNQSFDHIGHVYSCRVFLDFSGDNVLKNSLIVSPREYKYIIFWYWMVYFVSM